MILRIYGEDDLKLVCLSPFCEMRTEQNALLFVNRLEKKSFRLRGNVLTLRNLQNGLTYGISRDAMETLLSMTDGGRGAMRILTEGRFIE